VRNQLNRNLRDVFVKTDTVAFYGIRHSVDREHGGFMTSCDRDGRRSISDKRVGTRAVHCLLGSLTITRARENGLELASHSAVRDEHCFIGRWTDVVSCGRVMETNSKIAVTRSQRVMRDSIRELGR